MNENQFDEFFREKLLKYSSLIPGDMWQRIQIKKDKERKGFFFKWVLATWLLAFLIGGYFVLHTNKNLDNKKAILSSNKLNINTQNNPDKLSPPPGTIESIKAIPDTSHVNHTNKRISLAKEVYNNKTNISSAKHSNKKSKTDQYFSAKKASSGKYVSRQKERPRRQIIELQSFKDSMNINIKNASDSSISNYETNEDIIKKYPDSTNKRQENKTILLPKDSSLKKEETTLKNPSEKKSKLLPQQKKWFLDAYASPDIPFNAITSAD